MTMKILKNKTFYDKCDIKAKSDILNKSYGFVKLSFAKKNWRKII